MDKSSAQMIILYGSQTGNAEDMARRIGQRAKTQHSLKIQVLAMDDFQLKLLPRQQFILFVCATTGHGQEPENMKNFYNFIRRRDLPKDCLGDLKYAVYGLGSSSYAKFNYVAKIVFKRLRECGAEPVQQLVASDEQHQFGCDGLIYPKLEELWCTLAKIGLIHRPHDLPYPRDLPVIEKYRSYLAQIHPETDNSLPKICDIFSSEFKLKYSIQEASCVVNRRVTDPAHFQDTRLLCFRLTERVEYEPGDVCTIFPQNSEENIREFLRLLNLSPHQSCTVSKRDPDYMINYLYDFIPDRLELQDLVRHYLDIASVPKRSFFEHLCKLSRDPMEREKLTEFSTTEGQAELYEYCTKPKRSIIETMMDFPKTVEHIKLEDLFDMIPPIKPRSFSIASCLAKHTNELHLLVGVVNYKTSIRKARQGLCSNYLANMPTSDQCETRSKLRFFITRTSFKLPSDDKVPVIMIGPGLGISPFRGFIEQRALLGSRNLSHLYFGCRFRTKDFYFEEELMDLNEQRVISLRVAFSREKRTGRQYVQDLLAEDAQLISRLIKEESAVVYVAGNSKLPEELRAVLGKILSQQDGDSITSSEDCEQLVAGLETSGRVQYDCW